LDDAKANGYYSDLIEALEEELESPCTEEIAIFEQFANLLNEPKWDYFVLDTAPTGHTLRLLELPFEYKNQLDMKAKGNTNAAVAASTGVANTKIESLINRLKNPNEATFLLVAYPEFTPLHESFRAMKDLERVGIKAQGVFLNQILDEKDCTDNFSMERWKLQQHYLHQAWEIYYSKPLFAIPLQSAEIIGIKQVKALSELIFSKK
jgi:arsenite-transporting ATPase